MTMFAAVGTVNRIPNSPSRRKLRAFRERRTARPPEHQTRIKKCFDKSEKSTIIQRDRWPNQSRGFHSSHATVCVGKTSFAESFGDTNCFLAVGETVHDRSLLEFDRAKPLLVLPAEQFDYITLHCTNVCCTASLEPGRPPSLPPPSFKGLPLDDEVRRCANCWSAPLEAVKGHPSRLHLCASSPPFSGYRHHPI